MGHGTYSSTLHEERAETRGYFTKTLHETFTERSINSAMNPFGVKIREARDSSEHPESLAIILALDVTGSMGSVPHHLVKTGLPNIMDGIMKKGVKDPQILFVAVGDHECDSAPLQVAQFESSDELLDHWLTTVYLEGGGGSNYGESYLLAWYFAAYHTEIDCWDKRKKKGFLFTIGDEPTLKEIPSAVMKKLMGEGQHSKFSSSELLDKAREKYHVYHLHIRQTGAGGRQKTIDDWKQLMGESLVVIENANDVASVITGIVTNHLTEGMTMPEESKPVDKPSIIL